MLSGKTKERVFQRQSFRSVKEWVYFTIEYDLELCDVCHDRARPRTEEKPSEEWTCDGCEPGIHPDLWFSLRRRESLKTRCDLCHDEVDLRECWISEDCRRLYCVRHLKPLRGEDRYRQVRRFLGQWFRPRGRTRHDVSDLLIETDRHLRTVDCNRCTFNVRGIYDGDRLVELDREERACCSAPDTLNCAGLEH
jgi:hypothetical protein